MAVLLDTNMDVILQKEVDRPTRARSFVEINVTCKNATITTGRLATMDPQIGACRTVRYIILKPLRRACVATCSVTGTKTTTIMEH